jgi:hypothetical protein
MATPQQCVVLLRGPSQGTVGEIVISVDASGTLVVSVDGAPPVPVGGGVGNPWQGAAGAYSLPVTGPDSGLVNAQVVTQPVASDTIGLVTYGTPGIDISTGAAQDGKGGIFGCVLGGTADLSTPNIIDAGDFLNPQQGSFQRLVPIMLQCNYTYINTAGSPQPITRFVGIYIPHMPVNVVGGGAAVIKDVAELYMDGGIDPNGNVSVIGRHMSIWVGRGICADTFLETASGINGAGYLQMTVGDATPVAPAGAQRIVPSETSLGFRHSADTQGYKPFPVIMQSYSQIDPPATAYPSGVTVLKTCLPTDSTWKGMQSMDPRTWTLPTAIAIAGGQLNPVIRFNYGSGSSSGLFFTNTSVGGPVTTPRDSVSLGILGTWIKSIDLIVNNTSGSTSSSQDLGNFLVEWTAS